MSTVAQLLRASGLPALDARALLAHVLRVPREFVIAHPQQEVDRETAHRFETLARRRAEGEPLAYLTGLREFYGREFSVSAATLVPRPETELLIEVSLAALEETVQPRLLDLGTGSGCIAITLALQRPDAQVDASDRSAPALEVARLNAGRLGARVRFLLGEWYAGTPGPYELIVANPPYVPADDPHLSELRHEPATALISGNDGLSDLEAIIEGAPGRLAPAGWLAVEHGYDQAERVRGFFARGRFHCVQTWRDLQGNERVTVGQWG